MVDFFQRAFGFWNLFRFIFHSRKVVAKTFLRTSISRNNFAKSDVHLIESFMGRVKFSFFMPCISIHCRNRHHLVIMGHKPNICVKTFKQTHSTKAIYLVCDRKWNLVHLFFRSKIDRFL